MTASERKRLKAQWAKLAQVIGPRKPLPLGVRERYYRELMAERNEQEAQPCDS